MDTRHVDHTARRVRVFHDCRTHEARWGEFVTQAAYSWGGDSPRRHVMTRCDGSVMEAYDGDEGFEVIEEVTS